jgi:hypothetical protein
MRPVVMSAVVVMPMMNRRLSRDRAGEQNQHDRNSDEFTHKTTLSPLDVYTPPIG